MVDLSGGLSGPFGASSRPLNGEEGEPEKNDNLREQGPDVTGTFPASSDLLKDEPQSQTKAPTSVVDRDRIPTVDYLTKPPAFPMVGTRSP